MDNIDFIKTDDDYNINIKSICWVKQMSECMYICDKTKGCKLSHTHKICRNVSPSEYDKLDMKLNPTLVKFNLLNKPQLPRTTDFYTNIINS